MADAVQLPELPKDPEVRKPKGNPNERSFFSVECGDMLIVVQEPEVLIFCYEEM
ncbi:hypothetical protein [Desulfosediminicola sp.]|uniref:hypothetical protein n=1 Tax=Desulfosediminicola sp. TaxID=2886825 RepID=UPI003AF2D312